MPDTRKRIWLMEVGPRRAGGSIDAVIWVDPAENPEDTSVAYVLGTIADEHKRQRDLLLEAAKLGLVSIRNWSGIEVDAEWERFAKESPFVRKIRAAIAECEEGDTDV